MKFKDKIIKKLGGFTQKEFEAQDDSPSIHRMEQVYADIKSYVIDNDCLIYDKTQLARKIGERMLDNGLIDFTIKQSKDSIGSRIYEVRAKAYVGKFN